MQIRGKNRSFSRKEIPAMHVPFLDLKVQYRQIEPEVLPMMTQAMQNGAFIGGPQVTGFEEEFAAFCDSRHCIGVGSGTDALRFALMAAGVGPGHEVITVPNTFIATTEAISQAGARPVFVDVDPRTCNMDPAAIKDAVTPRTKAIVPVHLYGQPADMDPILDISARRGLAVIEDACQAHGARYRGQKAGSMGLAGCFSFYPGKNLGAFGEGGAVVTQDEALAAAMRMIRDHGQSQKYYHQIEGYNGRLDAIQAGVLRIKLKRLSAWNESRRRNAALYNRLLADIPGVTLPTEADFAQSVYHLYVIHTERRDELQRFLADRGIATGLHYPQPLHLQAAYSHFGHQKGDFPISESSAARLLSLPMYPELTREQIDYVVDTIKAFFEK
jgi:dTDP-4-amino-4,6-dideoxygalactose transaminase